MRHILDSLVNALERNESAVVGAIVKNSGSAPRTSGARMLVLSDGTLVGSVGGGELEGACQARAGGMLTGSESFAEMDFALSSTVAADAGMVCGGNVSVLLMKIEPESLGIFARLRNAYNNRKRCFLITVLPHGDQGPRLFVVDSQEQADFSEDFYRELLRKPRRVPFKMQFDNQELFIEPLIHPGTVHLAGAGHVALATARCAAFAGFEVVVMDDREEFANAKRYPQAREIRVLASFKDCFPDLGPDDYAVIVTRGHLHDREVLSQALRTGAGYIGMIGSRKKRDAVYRSLLEEGFLEEDLQRVCCPIGLAIGADTPEEIALSIVAEIVKARAGRGQ